MLKFWSSLDFHWPCYVYMKKGNGWTNKHTDKQTDGHLPKLYKDMKPTHTNRTSISGL